MKNGTSERYYPAFLDLQGRPCVVVGGGEVARRKTVGLLASGAQVTVVAPAIGPAIARLARLGRLAILARPFRSDDLEGAVLAIAATDDPETNRAVGREARRRRVLCNVVDQPQAGDFIAPAVLERGPVRVAVSTGGASPALAVRLVRELRAACGPEYGRLATLLGSLRETAHVRLPGPKLRRRFWQAAASPELLALCRERRVAEARRILLDALERLAPPLDREAAGLTQRRASDAGVRRRPGMDTGPNPAPRADGDAGRSSSSAGSAGRSGRDDTVRPQDGRGEQDGGRGIRAGCDRLVARAGSDRAPEVAL